MLAGTLLLAQSDRFPPANQANGMPTAEQALPGLSPSSSVNPQGDLLPQIRSAGTEIQQALAGHARRRLAKPQVQTGPEQVLYEFQGCNVQDGALPGELEIAGTLYGTTLVFDSSGNLYGTTAAGGAGCSNESYGNGTVFELSPSPSGGWTETILYRFQGGNDGSYPLGGLILDKKGNLYGTTVSGGNSNQGTVFELSPNGSGGWTKTILYNFQGAATTAPFRTAG
jgi:uncharacterized repeat protein (TIGR03803 family)